MQNVLVIDDSPTIHGLYKQCFGRVDGIALFFARHGAEGLAHIDRNGPPALVFLDINMPVMDGFEFLSEVASRGLLPRMPVVIVTTEGSTDDVQRGLAAGAVEYLRKPFRRDELAAVLHRRLPAALAARPAS